MTSQHGGMRPHAGRKKSTYGPTKFMRIPVGCLAQVTLVVRQYKEMMEKRFKEENRQ